MLLLSQNLVMAQFDPPRIATSLRHFDMGNNTEVDLKDRLYLLSKGVEANINEGDALSVYREVKPYRAIPRPLRIFIGSMSVMDSFNGSSIGRFIPNEHALAQPTIKYKTPLKQDIVVPRLVLDSGVLFDPGKADLKQKVEEEFKKVADFVLDFSPSKVIIEGHTDSDGDEDFNLQLSMTRAEIVRQYLINAYDSITPAMLEAKGYGESRPFTNNDTDDNKTLNRRIEILVWE